MLIHKTLISLLVLSALGYSSPLHAVEVSSDEIASAVQILAGRTAPNGASLTKEEILAASDPLYPLTAQFVSDRDAQEERVRLLAIISTIEDAWGRAGFDISGTSLAILFGIKVQYKKMTLAELILYTRVLKSEHERLAATIFHKK